MAGENPGSDLMDPPVRGCSFRSLTESVHQGQGIVTAMARGVPLEAEPCRSVSGTGPVGALGCMHTDHQGRVDLDLYVVSAPTL